MSGSARPPIATARAADDMAAQAAAIFPMPLTLPDLPGTDTRTMVPGPDTRRDRLEWAVQSDATHALVEDSDLIRRHAAALHLALMLADAITAIALFIGLSMIRFGTDAWQATWATAGIDGWLAALLYGISLVAVLWIQGLYRLRVRWSRRREALDVLFAVLLLAVVVFTALFLFKLPNVSRLFLVLLFPSQALLTIAEPEHRSASLFLSMREPPAATPGTCSSWARTRPPRRSPT